MQKIFSDYLYTRTTKYKALYWTSTLEMLPSAISGSLYSVVRPYIGPIFSPDLGDGPGINQIVFLNHCTYGPVFTNVYT